MTQSKKEELKKLMGTKYFLGSDSLTDEVSDWWLSQFDNLMNEKIAEIEKVKIEKKFPQYIKESYLDLDSQDYKTNSELQDRIFNQAVDKVITILKE